MSLAEDDSCGNGRDSHNRALESIFRMLNCILTVTSH